MKRIHLADMHSINNIRSGHHSNKPVLADSPTDTIKSGLCKTSSLDNGLDLLVGSDTVSVTSSLEGSDTTTPSSPPSVVYCVGDKNKNGLYLTPMDNGLIQLPLLPSLHGKKIDSNKTMIIWKISFKF